MAIDCQGTQEQSTAPAVTQAYRERQVALHWEIIRGKRVLPWVRESLGQAKPEKNFPMEGEPFYQKS